MVFKYLNIKMRTLISLRHLRREIWLPYIISPHISCPFLVLCGGRIQDTDATFSPLLTSLFMNMGDGLHLIEDGEASGVIMIS